MLSREQRKRGGREDEDRVKDANTDVVLEGGTEMKMGEPGAGLAMKNVMAVVRMELLVQAAGRNADIHTVCGDPDAAARGTGEIHDVNPPIPSTFTLTHVTVGSTEARVNIDTPADCETVPVTGDVSAGQAAIDQLYTEDKPMTPSIPTPRTHSEYAVPGNTGETVATGTATLVHDTPSTDH